MGKGRIYSIAEGDLFLQSKHADAAFTGTMESGFAVFWFDMPRKGKCLCVEYSPGNWPALHVTIQANWKARKHVANYRKDSASWSEGAF